MISRPAGKSSKPSRSRLSADSTSSPLLTVVVPVYNEAATIGAVLRALKRLRMSTEIIVVDDGSTDGSAEVLERESASGRFGIRTVTHRRNLGKGSAVRTGLKCARGRLTVIQDADLETDPRDVPRLVRALQRNPGAMVAGTRFPAGRRRAPRSLTGLANLIITWSTNLLFGSSLTDVTCAYKAAATDLLRSLGLKSRRFELEAEITAKLLRRSVAIHEIPVRYRPRTYRQGKKIHPLDGIGILFALARLRLFGGARSKGRVR